jgi:acetyl esterase/lipase
VALNPGAHLAAVCAIRARNRYPNIKITGQNLIVPATIAWLDQQIPAIWVDGLRSHEENAEALVLNERLYEMFVSALGVLDEQKGKGENFSMWGPLERLPPAYILVDEFDPIRD